MARIDELPPPPENYGPAWYPDPLGSTKRQRFWDGEKWTTMTRTGGAAPNMAPPPAAPPSEQEAIPAGWYPDPRGATNRELYWDGTKWTVYTRAIGGKAPKTAKTYAAGATIALLGFGALALGLIFGFFVAFDKSAPGFHEQARDQARHDASVRYEQTTTETETVTRQITTARPDTQP